MTPLARKMAAIVAEPKHRRDKELVEQSRFFLDDTHFFECTDISDPKILGDMSTVLRDVTTEGGYTAPYRFLPARKTWVEYKNPDDNSRFAYVCVELVEEPGFVLVFYIKGKEKGIECTTIGKLELGTGAVEIMHSRNERPGMKRFKEETPEPLREAARDAIRTCVLINLPHVLARKQHIVHKGAARKLGLAVGRFPLHGWTELSLDVHLAPKKDDSAVHEAGFTGGKCLHFCRAHLRLQNEKLVVVKSHWRGDPALGIKRTRYKMQAPKHEHAG